MNDNDQDQNMPQDIEDIRPNGLEPDPKEYGQQPPNRQNRFQKADFDDTRQPDWPRANALPPLSGKGNRQDRNQGRGNWPDDAPPVDLVEPRSSKARGFVVALLILGLIGAGGWYFVSHHWSKPKRLPGMGLLAAPAGAGAKAVASAAQPQTAAPARAVQAAVASAPAPEQAPLLSQPASGPGLAAAALAASTAAPGLPGVLPAVPAAALPAALPAASNEPSAAVQELQQRVEKLEDALASVQVRLEQESAARLAASNTAPAPQAAPRREPLAHPRAHPKAALAAASAAEPAPEPPKLGAQLLGVDLLNGTPSVVVTSGLPGDTRTRTLRPGDTLNGVTLRSADPATGQATFMSGGKTFTLSIWNGGV